MEVIPVQEATIVAAFSDLALVKARLANAPGVQVLSESFTETGAVLKAALPEANAQTIVQMLADATSGRALISIAES